MNQCYDCKYTGNVPGSAHNTCNHPKADFIGTLMGKNPLGITAKSHGVEMGWFMWPINFDPVWLINCDGLTEK